MEVKKPPCSYATSCFRKNPEHFKACSHVHLEQLLSKISGEKIVLPDDLGFPCTNKALLREQLEILRIVQEKTEEDVNVDKQKPDVLCLASSTDAGAPSTSGATDDSVPCKKPKLCDLAVQEKSYKRCMALRENTIQSMIKNNVMPAYLPPFGDFVVKWISADPYYLFFTAVPEIPATCKQDLSITFPEILDPSLGLIEQSLHSTMIVDIGWLIAQYMISGQDIQPKITLLYGIRSDEEGPIPKCITPNLIVCPSSFGSHHAKFSILQYSNGGIRIIISSANLYPDDWEYRTQGVWISPCLPRMNSSARKKDGESPTGFKADFLRYLGQYTENTAHIAYWKAIVCRADCSAIKVAFVASVPGEYNEQLMWGHKRLGAVLQQHAKVPDEETTIIAQASSIGSLGPGYRSWLGDLLNSFSEDQENKKKSVKFKFIWPTNENYANSLDLRHGSNCLCNAQHSKQKWIEQYMCKWKGDKMNRTPAIPHIKTYTRISEDNKRIWWFVLSSANLSKAAWGQYFGGKFRILSYEMGVVFLPKFLTGEEDFTVIEDATRSSPPFPLSYDLPLVPYTKDDEAYAFDHFTNS